MAISKPSHRTGIGTLCLGMMLLVALFPVRELVGKREAALATVQLTVVDEATGQPTPARIELLDAQGAGHIAEDALTVGAD